MMNDTNYSIINECEIIFWKVENRKFENFEFYNFENGKFYAKILLLLIQENLIDLLVELVVQRVWRFFMPKEI